MRDIGGVIQRRPHCAACHCAACHCAACLPVTALPAAAHASKHGAGGCSDGPKGPKTCLFLWPAAPAT